MGKRIVAGEWNPSHAFSTDRVMQSPSMYMYVLNVLAFFFRIFNRYSATVNASQKMTLRSPGPPLWIKFREPGVNERGCNVSSVWSYDSYAASEAARRLSS